MLKSFVVSASIATLLASAALAGDLSRVRCEDQPMLDLIKGELPKMKLEDGSSFSTYLGNNTGLTAKTVSATSDRVVCQISLNLSYGGQSLKVRGQFIYREFAGGKASVSFLPFN